MIHRNRPDGEKFLESSGRDRGRSGCEALKRAFVRIDDHPDEIELHVRRAGGFDGVCPITLLIVQTPKRNLIALPDDVAASVVRPNASSIAPALHLGTSTEVR